MARYPVSRDHFHSPTHQKLAPKWLSVIAAMDSLVRCLKKACGIQAHLRGRPDDLFSRKWSDLSENEQTCALRMCMYRSESA